MLYEKTTHVDLLMNSVHKAKARSVWPSLLGLQVILLIWMSCQLTVIVHGLLASAVVFNQ